MGFPKFGSNTFRNAVLGVGALALTSLPSTAQEGPPVLNAPRAAAVATMTTDIPTTDGTLPAVFRGPATDEAPALTRTSTADSLLLTSAEYREWGLPTPQSPTADRPYHYVRFDQGTENRYEGGPIEMGAAHRDDFIVVMNFIDEQNAEYSTRQTELLQKTLSHLAPQSQAKGLMLVDVIVRDRAGNMPYGSTYTALYDSNTLGPDESPKAEYTLPYGIVSGEPFAANSNTILYDFGLYDGVQTSADLDANSRAIFGVMLSIVDNYNKKNVAALNPTVSGATTLFASNE